MRSRFLVLWMVAALATAVLIVAPTAHVAHASPSGVVISAVYGGGGNSGATYSHDYITLFNAGSSMVSLKDWSVQYADASPAYHWEKTFLPDVMLAPGQSFMARQDKGVCAAGGCVKPPKDAKGSASIASNGAVSVALVRSRTTIADLTSPYDDPNISPHIEDVFGAGTSTIFEGSVRTGALDNTMAWIRVDGGCQDTNNSQNDFTSVIAYPTARSMKSPLAPCSATELVDNGGFESDTASWTLAGSAKIKCGDKGNGSDCSLQVKSGAKVSQALSGGSTDAGDLVQVSADVKTKIATKSVVILVKLNYVSPSAGKKGNGKDKIKLVIAKKTSGFQAFSTVFTLDDEVSDATVLVKYGTSSKAFVDNVSVLVIDSVSRGPLALPAASGVLPPPPPPAN